MGVMSVLSFSDIKYVGEQSRGTKVAEDILEDPTLMQVDYSRERAGDHLSLAVSKEILMEVDCSRQVPNGDNMDDSHRMVGTLKEFNCASLRSFEELPSDVHVAENPLSNIDEKVSNTFDERARFSKTYSSSLEGCNQSNVKEAVYRGLESFRGMNSESYSKGKNKDICVGGLGVDGVESLFESSNCGILTNGMTGGIIKDKEVDVPCNAYSVLINTPHTSAESRATSVLHKPPDLACRADSDHECKHRHGNQDAGLQGTDSVAGGHVVHVIESLMESIPCDVDSVLANTPSSHAESGDIPSVLHMTPDLSTGCKQPDGSQDGESGLRGTESAENDHSVALWVKWRGKWKTGIQCHLADCPLTTLRAKPTHERKKYIAVFFPRSKIYSWVDVLLVRPIEESPEPLAYGSHRKWRKLVKDLTVPRHYIMQKLSVAMLNVSDQLHTEAVIENARKATTWKDFALESSRCRDYSELGRMLLKLQTMILHRYIIHDWLENSFDSWLQRCQSARSAESIEVLTENPQLKCACPHPHCHPEKCDHVYLFDNDYENAEDIHGKPMRGRFPYADKGQIVLAEGYLVYECNSSCNCDSTCQNRVLQRGIQVKMEIFRTVNKGWAVRAREAISRGTFVCEYIGEVLSDVEANKKGQRYGSTGCSYLYDIDAHIDGAKEGSKQTVSCLIDATKYGNVSRFINHSCSPNLASYLVLVESMDCQLAHVGLYASRDIAAGEELAYDYRNELLPGDGCPCHCGAPNCRGRLY